MSCKTKSAVTVNFPEVSEPVQITSNDKEHFFASYYGINSFSQSERYVTVIQTSLKHKIPDNEVEPATLGLVDLKTNEFIPLTETRAWNFQQGCMAHWLSTSPDSLIIFNDLRENRFISVIMNVHTKKEIKIIPHPVAAVSPNGKEAISLNFARIRITRPDYGYGGEGQDSRESDSFPKDDGLRLVNLETGESEIIISIEQLKNLVPVLEKESILYFNHVLFSREGTKIFWLARALPIPWKNTTAFTVNRDGTNLQKCFPNGWNGSHYDWLNDNELMITSEFDAKQYAHILFTVGKNDYKRLGKGILDYDGHGTFSHDGKWMITDTYPRDGLHEQKIYLMDMKTEAVLSLGRFVQPEEYKGGWRCDIHCRWSPSGNFIGFNSTHSGKRQAYVMKLKY